MATQTYLRQLNRRRVIQAMLRLRVAARGEIAHAAGLSQPTVGRIVDELLSEQIFAKSITTGELLKPGRPSEQLTLDRGRKRFLAIELGVEETRIAAVPVGVEDRDSWDAHFPTPGSAKAWAQVLVKTVASLPAAGEGPQAVILSVPGVVDEGQSRPILCPNIPWAPQADFAALLKPICPTPPILIQEIRALALGQLLAEPGLSDFLLVDVGAGVGASAVVRGELYHSPLALSGELGHIPVAGNTRPCGCGSAGCVETLISRAGLLLTAKEKHIAGTWPALVKHIHGAGVEPWLADALDALAMSMISGVNILGIRTVLLSGMLNEFPGPITDYLAKGLGKGAMWARFGEVTLRLIPRRRIAGMVLAGISKVLV